MRSSPILVPGKRSLTLNTRPVSHRPDPNPGRGDPRAACQRCVRNPAMSVARCGDGPERHLDLDFALRVHHDPRKGHRLDPRMGDGALACLRSAELHAADADLKRACPHQAKLGRRRDQVEAGRRRGDRDDVRRSCRGLMEALEAHCKLTKAGTASLSSAAPPRPPSSAPGSGTARARHGSGEGPADHVHWSPHPLRVVSDRRRREREGPSSGPGGMAGE